MKIGTEKMKKNIFLQLALLLAFFLISCSSVEEDDDFILYPINSSFDYRLFPNDAATNDSAAAHLAEGIVLRVSPFGKYVLSFEGDTSFSPPQLQLFRIYYRQGESYISNVRKIEPEIEEGRFVYRFVCEESKPTSWVTSLLGEENTFYKGKVQRLAFKGEGIYPESFSLRFVQVGRFTGTTDSLTFEQLSKKIYKKFKEYFTGIEIDTFYIAKAEEITSESSFPSDKPFIFPYAEATNENIFYPELTSAIDEKESAALDLVIGHLIDLPGVLGYSALFAGSMLDSAPAVVLATHSETFDGIEMLPSEEIAISAIHETGHFFGLRHTTATSSEMLSENDYSNVEDGIADTPFCGSLIASKIPALMKKSLPWNPIFRTIAEARLSCPDESNIMYPLSYGNEQSFSEKQLEIIRRNLTLTRH